jgi:glucose-6-phosphate isomerase
MAAREKITAYEPNSLAALFADDGSRTEALTLEQSGIRFDFAKTHLDAELLEYFNQLAEKMQLAAKREALFHGEIVNPTEGRAAEHTAERGNGNAATVEIAKALHIRMRGLVEAIEAGVFGEIKHLLHIGIGGSALGPKLLVDALGRDGTNFDVKIVSNIDATALAEATANMDPQKTLVAIASKTFTTTETLMNAESAIEWLTEGGVEDARGRCIALTAKPEKALEWGIDESRILPFNESVGGRYSLWCSIGFPAALGLGLKERG